MNIYEACFAIIAFVELWVIIKMDKINREQYGRIKSLTEEKVTMLGVLRLKGIEVDRLWKRIKKAEKDFNIRIVG